MRSRQTEKIDIDPFCVVKIVSSLSESYRATMFTKFWSGVCRPFSRAKIIPWNWFQISQTETFGGIWWFIFWVQCLGDAAAFCGLRKRLKHFVPQQMHGPQVQRTPLVMSEVVTSQSTSPVGAQMLANSSHHKWWTTGICPPGVDTVDTHQLGSPHPPQSTDHLSHSCQPARKEGGSGNAKCSQSQTESKTAILFAQITWKMPNYANIWSQKIAKKQPKKKT